MENPFEILQQLIEERFNRLEELLNQKLITNTLIKDEGDLYLRSIKDISDFLGCSTTTSQAFKNKHRRIFNHYGRKFIVLKSDLIEALQNDTKKRLKF